MRVSQAIIEIDLPNHLVDFLYHEFKTEGNVIILETTAQKPIGKFINSMWEISQYPVKKIQMNNPIKIKIPVRDFNTSQLRYFLYVPRHKQEMILDYMQAAFELRREKFFMEGYRKGFPQKLIIEAFMKAYGMKYNSQNFDQLKKFDYRNRDCFSKKIASEIRSVDY